MVAPRPVWILPKAGGLTRSAETLLARVLGRQSQFFAMDPNVLIQDPLKERRLRRLNDTATIYRRDTGINALYLGFPFVVLRDANSGETAKPRIAPVLLWPIKLETPSGSRGSIQLAFDSDRQEVRINPALEGILGPVGPRWVEVLNEIRGKDLMDLQGMADALAILDVKLPQEGVQMVPLPSPTVKVAAGVVHIYLSAVLFLADFSGQPIAEDLKQIARTPH